MRLLSILLCIIPSIAVAETNPSVGKNNLAAPGYSTLISGKDGSGNTKVLSINGTGGLTVAVAVNTAGSHTTGNVSTVITLTAPANVVGFILQAKDTNTANLRWASGATATTSVGMQLQPGRDTGYVPLAANVSVVSESGTQEYEIQWIKTN